MTHQELTRNTLLTLMSLIDNHVDDLNEGDYIDICRMLKFIHSNPQIIPAEINMNSNQSHQPRPQTQQPSQSQIIQQRLDSAIRILQHFDDSRASVKLDDKMAVIRERHKDVMVLVMGNPLYFDHNLRSKISVMEAHLIGNCIVRKRDLISAYQDRRDRRIEAQRAPLARNVSALRAELENLTN